MPKASVTRHIAREKKKLIDFVLDIEKYPEFIPFCLDSKVYERNDKKDEIAINLINKMVDKTYRNIAISCSKLICKDFTAVGLFFNDSVNYSDFKPKINNIINYDFKNNKYV